MIDNENVLKQKDEELAQKCKVLDKENKILKQKCSTMSEECLQKEIVVQEMKKEYDGMKLSYHTVKEAYEDVKSQMKRIQARITEYSETSQTLKNKYEIKEHVVNQYIDEVAEFKRKMVDLEQENNKLHSYHASSYILERNFNIKPDDNDSEKNKKEIGSEYHQVPPPFEKKFTFYDDEKVAKAFNMVDQLTDNFDVNYSKSDDIDDSQVVGKVVESILIEDTSKNYKYESQDENLKKNYEIN
ncbi:hypothetical protein Hanom_Chr05g00398231 [Helianthus anomalus]